MATSLHLSSCSSMTLAQRRSGSELSRAHCMVACLPPSVHPFFPATRSISTSRPPLTRTGATAAETKQMDSSELSEKEKRGVGKYHFVVANAKFMLDDEEHFKEVLFERLRLFQERNREQDFWLVIEPKFLDKFPSVTNRLNRPAVALVSTDAAWITFMKLRLDRVLSAEYEAGSLEEALASKPTDVKFPSPDKWVAPYPKYEYGWWEPFLPPTKFGTLKQQEVISEVKATKAGSPEILSSRLVVHT